MRTFIIITILAIVTSCTKEPWDGNNQFRFKIFNDECIINTDDVHLLLNVAAYRNRDDSVFLNTYEIGRKLEISLNQVNTNSKMFSLLNDLCNGDSVILECVSDSFYMPFGGQVPYYLTSGEKVTYTIFVHDRLNRENYLFYKYSFEEKGIKSFIKEINWTPELDTASGIYYEKITENIDAEKIPQKGKIKYAIHTISGKLIDASKEDDYFKYDLENKGLLPGLRIILGKMKVTEKIKAIIPSHQAYGAEGEHNVPGFTPVIIEIELVEAIE
jgi:hypothetical protein